MHPYQCHAMMQCSRTEGDRFRPSSQYSLSLSSSSSRKPTEEVSPVAQEFLCPNGSS